MNLEEQSKQIEISIEQAEKQVKRAESLEKLFKNRDFKMLIEEGYLKEYPLSQLRQPQTEDIVKELDSIARFNLWIGSVFALGNQASNAIKQHEQELKYIEEEEEGSI